MTMGLFTSCGDNDDVCSPHVLTDAEIAEMERQDSIKQAALNAINADLVLSYTVEDYASASNWTVKNLSIDLDAIANLFGLTVDELKSGIKQEDGAPEVKGFAILASTHNDSSVASSTNTKWGHWWNTDGDLCEKYNDSNSAFYCQWEGEYFSVGQFPGHLTAGQEITVIEGLKYGDKRAAIKITFKCIERESLSGDIVDTKEYELKADVDSNFVTSPVYIDMTDIMSKLGVTSVDDVSVIGVNADGSYVQEFTADYGFWYTKEGIPTTWVETPYAFISYMGKADEENKNITQLAVGQYPKACQSGDTAELPIYFYANKKFVKVIVKLFIN